MAMTVDLLQLREWSDRLCRLPATEPLLVVAALRVGAAPAAHIRGVGAIDPPPTGTSRCELALAEGRFRSLSLTFARPAIARAGLEDAMGPGLPLRRLGVGRPHRIAYRVVVSGAPFSCDVVASFAEPPTPRSLVTAVTLRRHRGVTAVATARDGEGPGNGVGPGNGGAPGSGAPTDGHARPVRAR